MNMYVCLMDYLLRLAFVNSRTSLSSSFFLYSFVANICQHAFHYIWTASDFLFKTKDWIHEKMKIYTLILAEILVCPFVDFSPEGCANLPIESLN